MTNRRSFAIRDVCSRRRRAAGPGPGRRPVCSVRPRRHQRHHLPAGRSSRRWSRAASSGSWRRTPTPTVIYTPLDLQLYPEKMVALFNASTQADAFYVRDTHLGAWVEAGWVQPIDGMPKLAELNKDIFPATLRDAVLQGQAVRRAVLRRHLPLPLRQEAAREGRREEAAGHAGRAQERCAGSQEGGHRAVPDPQGLQDQHRRARRILVDGIRLGRTPVQR